MVFRIIVPWVNQFILVHLQDSSRGHIKPDNPSHRPQRRKRSTSINQVEDRAERCQDLSVSQIRCVRRLRLSFTALMKLNCGVRYFPRFPSGSRIPSSDDASDPVLLVLLRPAIVSDDNPDLLPWASGTHRTSNTNNGASSRGFDIDLRRNYIGPVYSNTT